MKPFIVSPAPHFHSGDSVRKNMLLVIIALLPAYGISIWQFGWGALITTAISVVACVLFEWLIAKFILKQKATIGDLSAVLTGLLLAFNLPSNLPWWIVVIGALVAIGVAKMSFGGLGQNLFNPALVGRVFLLISFPAQMTTWLTPKGFNTIYSQKALVVAQEAEAAAQEAAKAVDAATSATIDAVTSATPLAALKEAVKNDKVDMLQDVPELWDLVLGKVGGSFGEVSALLLLLGGLFLIATRVITWHIPVSITLTVALFAAVTGWAGTLPEGLGTCEYVGMSLCTGGMMLGTWFMATDYVTSPMSNWGKIIFGIGIGLIVMVIRTWGAYPEGMSFAILIMNACVPLLNLIRPKRFGEKKKK